MLSFLAWVPVGTSLILGVVCLFLGDGRPAFKILGIVVFLAAVYLQFLSRYSLVGLLLQIVLALCLALWRRMDLST
jgi:hypothetical protein